MCKNRLNNFTVKIEGQYENGKIAQGKYIASFIGFAPYDNPEFEIYVIIDEPKGAYYGGVVAAPVAGEIFRNIFELFKYNQINNKEYEKFTLDTFIGMTLTQSASKLGELNLQYLTQGDGEFVTGQIPSPGTEVSQGDVVLLIFE